MKRTWKRVLAGFMAAGLVITSGIFPESARVVKAADNKIVVDYNTSIGTGTSELFGGVGTPGKEQETAWEALSGMMQIKIVKVQIDLASLFPENADIMDTEAYENYAHVAGSILARVRGSNMKAMLEFTNLPEWLKESNGMYKDKVQYQKILNKFLGDLKGEYETIISHVEIVPPSELEDAQFTEYYFVTAEVVRAHLTDVKIGGMGHELTSTSSKIPMNVKAVLKQSNEMDESLLQFVSVRGYQAEPTDGNSPKEYFGEFKNGRKEIRAAVGNRYMPLYMTGWSTAGKDTEAADAKVTGAEGIKYHVSALFKAMRDGWNLVLFDGTVSDRENAGSYTYKYTQDGKTTLNPFSKAYNLLGAGLGLNKGNFTVVSTDMGSSWPVDDSIAMVNSEGQAIILLMNFARAKSDIQIEMKNVPYEDGAVKLNAYVASENEDSQNVYATIEAEIRNGILSAKIPLMPENCAMGLIVVDGVSRQLPAQSMYEFESQDNHFGGNTEVSWVTGASFNRVVKGFGGIDNFVTLQNVAADGDGTYLAHLYAAQPNKNVKVSVNNGEVISLDTSNVSVQSPKTFEVKLKAGNNNQLKFYTESGELKPDRLVLEAKDIQLSLGIQNLSELAREEEKYILPLSQKNFKVDARIFPESSEAGKILCYESSDTEVVEVTPEGLLIPKTVGESTITVKIEGTDVKSSFDIVVKNAVESVKVSPKTLILKEGNTSVLTVVIAPEDAQNQHVSWTSSNPDIVRIIEQTDTSVSVQAVASRGDAIITATTEDGGKTSSCAVTVVEPISGGNVIVDYGSTIAVGDPKIFGVTHYPSVNDKDSDIGNHSNVWPMLTEQAGVKFMRADARLQEILPVWTKTPDTNWEKPLDYNRDQPSYVKSDYYYVTGPDGVKRKFNLEDYQADMSYYQEHGEYLNGLSNPENWNMNRLMSWVTAADEQEYEIMVMTFQIPEWLSAGELGGGDPHTKKVCNGAPKDWAVYRDIIKKVYIALRDKIHYYEFLNEPHWYIPTHGDQKDPAGNRYEGDIVNQIAADQFYQAIDAIYEAEAEITGNENAEPAVQLGGGADDSWGGEYGVLGTIFSDEYADWTDRVDFVSIHKYGDRPTNQDDSNGGANSRNVKYYLREKTGRNIPLFLNEYNISTGQPMDETYGYKSVGWHAKNLIDMMVEGYSGGGYYTCYPADVPMDDYEASSGWIEKGKGMYTWNNGNPYLANFTKTWGLLSNKLGLGNGSFSVKQSRIEGKMSHATGAVNASGDAVAFLNNYSGQSYDNVTVEMKNVPYASGTEVTASIYMMTSESDINMAPIAVQSTVDNYGNVAIVIPEIASWGIAGVVLSGTQQGKADTNYEFESYTNEFAGKARIEKNAKASNTRWITGVKGRENAVTVPMMKDENGSVVLNVFYAAEEDSTLVYTMEGIEKEVKLPAVSGIGQAEVKEILKAGVNQIGFYTKESGIQLDRVTVNSLDKSELKKLIDIEFTKEGYTDKSWAVYEDARNDAIAVFENEKATGEEVESVYKKLTDAIKQLVLMVDLSELISHAEEKKAGDYATETWVVFKAALENAKEVVNDKDAAQEEHISAYKELEETMNALTLVLKEEGNSIIEGKMPISNREGKNFEKATDGDINNTDRNQESFAQLEAGPETGGSDNGYSNWDDVYLQYDFGSVYDVSRVNVYRTYYDNGGFINWKNCKIELSENPEFQEGETTVIAYDETLRTEAQQTDPQEIKLEQPVHARYLRVTGRGHQGSWGGYSNKINYSEIQVFGVFKPDRSYLEQLIETAEAVDESKYTESTVKILKEALQRAKQIDENVSLEEVNQAASDLYNAIQNLVILADFAKLSEAIQALTEKMQQKEWEQLSEEEQIVFDKLKKDLESVMNNPEELQETVDEMTVKIQNAVEDIQKLYEKNAAKIILEQLVKEAKEMNLGKYTEESVEILKEMIQEAETGLQENDLSMEECRNLYDALNQAMNSLVEKQLEDEKKSDHDIEEDKTGTSDRNQPVKTGDHTNGFAWITLLTAAMITCLQLWKRKRKGIK